MKVLKKVSGKWVAALDLVTLKEKLLSFRDFEVPVT